MLVSTPPSVSESWPMPGSAATARGFGSRPGEKVFWPAASVRKHVGLPLRDDSYLWLRPRGCCKVGGFGFRPACVSMLAFRSGATATFGPGLVSCTGRRLVLRPALRVPAFRSMIVTARRGHVPRAFAARFGNISSRPAPEASVTTIPRHHNREGFMLSASVREHVRHSTPHTE